MFLFAVRRISAAHGFRGPGADTGSYLVVEGTSWGLESEPGESSNS